MRLVLFALAAAASAATSTSVERECHAGAAWLLRAAASRHADASETALAYLADAAEMQGSAAPAADRTCLAVPGSGALRAESVAELSSASILGLAREYCVPVVVGVFSATATGTKYSQAVLAELETLYTAGRILVIVASEAGVLEAAKGMHRNPLTGELLASHYDDWLLRWAGPASDTVANVVVNARYVV